MINKFSNKYCVLAFIVGLSSGLGLTTLAYHKGKKDAYEDVENHLQNVVEDVK